MSKYKHLEMVHIQWEDSESLSDWCELGDLQHDHDLIDTVGFLIHSDEKTYLIASTYDGTRDSINAAIWIPKSAVKSVRPMGSIRIRADN